MRDIKDLIIKYIVCHTNLTVFLFQKATASLLELVQVMKNALVMGFVFHLENAYQNFASVTLAILAHIVKKN